MDADKEITRWLNVYRNEDGYTYFGSGHVTREAADRVVDGASGRIACLKLEFNSGDGLDKAPA
jgi:hypothetical protein